MRVIRVLKALAVVAIIGSLFVSAGPVEAQSKRVKIAGISCKKPTLGSDTDEIYFRVLRRGIRYPSKGSHRIKKAGIWRPNFEFNLEKGAHIRVYEADTIGEDDVIGDIIIPPNATLGVHVQVLRGDLSHYEVGYFVQ